MLAIETLDSLDMHVHVPIYDTIRHIDPAILQRSFIIVDFISIISLGMNLVLYCTVFLTVTFCK